jgi:hypothetical protein
MERLSMLMGTPSNELRTISEMQTEVRAVLMVVPEAALNEDHGAVFRQNDIGFAGGYLFFGPLTVKR